MVEARGEWWRAIRRPRVIVEEERVVALVRGVGGAQSVSDVVSLQQHAVNGLQRTRPDEELLHAKRRETDARVENGEHEMNAAMMVRAMWIGARTAGDSRSLCRNGQRSTAASAAARATSDTSPERSAAGATGTRRSKSATRHIDVFGSPYVLRRATSTSRCAIEGVRRPWNEFYVYSASKCVGDGWTWSKTKAWR